MAGSRKGGIGLDSSVGESGTKEIGDGVGGDVRRKERISVGTEALQGSFCGGLQGSFCGGLNMDRKSHLQIFHDTIIDVRRMYSPSYILSNQLNCHRMSLKHCTDH